MSFLRTTFEIAKNIGNAVCDFIDPIRAAHRSLDRLKNSDSLAGWPETLSHATSALMDFVVIGSEIRDAPVRNEYATDLAKILIQKGFHVYDPELEAASVSAADPALSNTYTDITRAVRQLIELGSLDNQLVNALDRAAKNRNRPAPSPDTVISPKGFEM